MQYGNNDSNKDKRKEEYAVYGGIGFDDSDYIHHGIYTIRVFEDTRNFHYISYSTSGCGSDDTGTGRRSNLRSCFWYYQPDAVLWYESYGRDAS